VSGVQPQVMLPLNPTTSQFMTLTQELVLGMDLSVPMPNRHYRELPVRNGRFLRDGDRHVAVLGASLAASRGLDVGGRLVLEGQPYEVVGVLDRMLTAPDRFVIVSIADAREQWVAKDPMIRTLLASGAAALTAGDLNTGAAVGWRDGADPDAVARRIRAEVKDVNVQLPSELSRLLRLLRQSTAFFSALLGGIAALAFVIGGLSLANTIAAAVFERVRDFGVKRALGASDLQLGREVLAESLAVTLWRPRGHRDRRRARLRHRRVGGAHGAAALLFLAAPARRRAGILRAARRRVGDVRDRAHRAPVAGRSDPARRLTCSCARRA
jgi:hypothetical protein